MPPRRPHSKSRLGCKQCKQRRVKCDETYPICSNCERRDFDCSFQYSGPPPKRPNSIPTRSSTNALRASATDSSAAPSPVWSPHLKSDSPFSRTAELQLMHYWSVETYKSLGDSQFDLDRSQTLLPSLALNSEYLLDSLFSMTALHLAFEADDEGEKTRYGDMAIAYQDRALTRFRASLGDPRPEQGPALFYSSAIIGIISFTLPRAYPTGDLVGPTATLIHMSRLISGTMAISDLCKEMMGEETWKIVFPDDPDPKPDLPLDPEVAQIVCQLDVLAAAADGNVARGAVSPQSDAKPVYSNSVDNLRKCLIKVSSDTGSALGWPVEAGPEFGSLLEAGDPLARLITICYALLLYMIDNLWWASNSAHELVDELSPLVTKTNPEWSDIVNFIRLRVGLQSL